MRITTGTVVQGRVVVEGEALVEGAKVTIVAFEDGDRFEVGPEEEAVLLHAMAEADRGESIAFDQWRNS